MRPDNSSITWPRGGRADSSEAIRARRRQRLAEGAHHLCEKRMRAHSHRNRLQAGGHDRRHQFRRGRTIVSGPGQNFAINRSINGRASFFDHRDPFQPIQLWQMDDQRIEMRALFRFENLHHRFGGKRISGQAVDRLGRQRDHFARRAAESTARAHRSACDR